MDSSSVNCWGVLEATGFAGLIGSQSVLAFHVVFDFNNFMRLQFLNVWSCAKYLSMVVCQCADSSFFVGIFICRGGSLSNLVIDYIVVLFVSFISYLAFHAGSFIFTTVGCCWNCFCNF